LLSSVVLASLNSARAKGADATIKADISNIRSEAELFYDDNAGVYTGVCADPQIAAMIAGATTAGSADVDCNAVADEYAASAQYKSDTAKWWCVDSTGVSKETAATLAAATVCP